MDLTLENFILYSLMCEFVDLALVYLPGVRTLSMILKNFHIVKFFLVAYDFSLIWELTT